MTKTLNFMFEAAMSSSIDPVVQTTQQATVAIIVGLVVLQALFTAGRGGWSERKR